MKSSLTAFKTLVAPLSPPPLDRRHRCPSCGDGKARVKVNEDWDCWFCLNVNCKRCDQPGDYTKRGEAPFINFDSGGD